MDRQHRSDRTNYKRYLSEPEASSLPREMLRRRRILAGVQVFSLQYWLSVACHLSLKSEKNTVYGRYPCKNYNVSITPQMPNLEFEAEP